MIADTAALCRWFPGWSPADVRAMPVRERRHWTEWAAAVAEREQQKRENERARMRPATEGRRF